MMLGIGAFDEVEGPLIVISRDTQCSSFLFLLFSLPKCSKFLMNTKLRRIDVASIYLLSRVWLAGSGMDM